MRFYTKAHRYYCGIDLHARRMYICILDADGQIRVHRNGPATPEHLLATIAPYREDLVVAVECIFTWYWVADLCAREDIAFVLGHALYMKAIHGGKAKNDKIDAHKIAVLLRGGMLPMAYVYPRAMRATRDLLRRRCHFMRKRAELITHIQNTATQYLLPPFGKKIAAKRHRTDVADQFSDAAVRKSIETNLALLDHYDRLLTDLELYLTRTAKVHDVHTFARLRSVPGIGQILGLVLLYEIHDIQRFPSVQDFVSSCRLVKCGKESDGKHYGYSGAKIGNAHLKWAFSEAAVLCLPESRGPAVRGAPHPAPRQGQGPHHLRSQTRPRRLLHAPPRTGLRCHQVLRRDRHRRGASPCPSRARRSPRPGDPRRPASGSAPTPHPASTPPVPKSRDHDDLRVTGFRSRGTDEPAA
jgi:transposase